MLEQDSPDALYEYRLPYLRLVKEARYPSRL